MYSYRGQYIFNNCFLNIACLHKCGVVGLAQYILHLEYIYNQPIEMQNVNRETRYTCVHSMTEF